MSKEFSNLDGEESLKAENEFLKMKLMLERGAQFGSSDGESGISPELENRFLNNIIEFERQADNPVYTTVFDRIGKPDHFQPVAEIPDDKIAQAWDELSEFLEQHGISIDACSPNVTKRELYRFTTEELFKQEITIVDIPGMMTCFIYDEFYPDPIYDNSRMIEQDFFRDIFCKRDLFYDIHYSSRGFEFNDTQYAERQSYIDRINRFKSVFDEIELEECKVKYCTVNENDCQVKGDYRAIAKTSNSENLFQGNYLIELARENDYWHIKKIWIERFNP